MQSPPRDRAIALGATIPRFRGDGFRSTVEREGYRTEVERGRIRLIPTHAVHGTSLEIETERVARGEVELPLRSPEMRRTNDGQLRVERGAVTENLDNHAEGLEQSWRLDRPPPGEGPLEIRVATSGAPYVETNNRGLLFGTAEAGFVYGHAVFIDANGIRHSIPSRFEEGTIVLRVPGAVIDSAAYPAVLDPVLGPRYDPRAPSYRAAAGRNGVPAVAFDGTNYLAAYTTYESPVDTRIAVTRVSASGSVLDRDPTVLPLTAGYDANEVAVAFDGTNFLVAWSWGVPVFSGISIVRIGRDGALQDEPQIDVATGSGYSSPAIASDGRGSLLVWRQSVFGGSGLRAARVPSGSVPRPGPPVLVSPTGHDPCVAFDGTNYVIGWADGSPGSRQIRAARMTTARTLLDPGGVTISASAADQRNPAIAYDGANYLLTWEDDRGADTRIFGARVSPGAVVLDSGLLLSRAGGDYQYAPTVVGGSSGFLVAWEEYATSGGDPVLHATRVASTGGLLDPTGFPILAGSAAQYTPALAFDGAVYLTVWSGEASTGYTNIYAARVSTAGAVVDSSPRLVSVAQSNIAASPDVAFDGSNYLVVWRDLASEAVLRASRVTPWGAVLDAEAIEIPTSEAVSLPRVEYAAGTYLVIWTEADVTRGVLVDPSGTVGSGFDISGPTSDAAAQIASDGSGFFVVWEDERGVDLDIYGARVTASGSVLDPAGIRLSSAVGRELLPAIGFDGTNWIAAWTQDVSTVNRVQATRISTAGVVLDPGGFRVNFNVSRSETADAIASDGSGSFIVSRVRNGTTTNIVGARVTPSGSVLDMPPIAITRSTDRGDAVFDGVDYLVLPSALRRFDTTGRFIDVTSIGSNTSPRLASNGAQAGLIVFENSRRVWARGFDPTCVSVGATDDTCDSVDDDCDGTTDESFPTTGGFTCGVGACERAGMQSCVVGVVLEECFPGAPAASDVTCDRVDDDCDMLIDEDCTSPPDAGLPDAGFDAGAGDAGLPTGTDAGGGTADGGVLDGGGMITDGGTDDAGSPLDAAMGDAATDLDAGGTPDTDAGRLAGTDGGAATLDAGATPDAGTDPGAGGCACRAAPPRSTAPLLPLLALGALVALRRRVGCGRVSSSCPRRDPPSASMSRRLTSGSVLLRSRSPSE